MQALKWFVKALKDICKLNRPALRPIQDKDTEKADSPKLTHSLRPGERICCMKQWRPTFLAGLSQIMHHTFPGCHLDPIPLPHLLLYFLLQLPLSCLPPLWSPVCHTNRLLMPLMHGHPCPKRWAITYASGQANGYKVWGRGSEIFNNYREGLSLTLCVSGNILEARTLILGS